MGITIFHFVSLYTFLMGSLWFNAFVLLSLLMRKLKYPIKFSVRPLAILLILSLVRMFVPIQPPAGVIHILSETIFPAIIDLLRYEVISNTMFGFSFNVLHTLSLIWGSVSIILLIRLVLRYRKAYQIISLFEYVPDEKAQAILTNITGPTSQGRVFRTPMKIPFTAGIKPHIYLPEDVDFTDEELHTILRHEWKHIENKDHLITYFMYLFCCVFWWNPLVYVLKNNVFFTQELKCDYFAVAMSDEDPQHYVDGILRLCGAEANDILVTGNMLARSQDEVADRFHLLALRENDKSSKKRTFASVCFYLALGALFVLSYMFIILPAHWESDYQHVSDGIERPIDHADADISEEAFRAEEAFLIDNGDGTFSIYIDGQHVGYRTADEMNEDILRFFQIQPQVD
ncbi:MAG: M56 family metallopeptidase [Oscillospiraceae bacterium]|nr:M56 family metallopeptidase [Oscillospiraceae bacterium]